MQPVVERMRSRLHRWPFSQLQTFVEYKAQTMGIEVIYVNAAYSSQTCSKCQKIGIRKNIVLNVRIVEVNSTLTSMHVKISVDLLYPLILQRAQ